MQQNTPKLTIREGGFYRTRDGRKVGKIIRALEIDGHAFVDLGSGHIYSPDGTCRASLRDLDLIAEWRDEGTLRDLDVKPGDVVECVTSKTSATAPGSHYTIAVCPLDGDPRSYLDDEGDWCEDTPGYTFRLVSRAPATDTDAAAIQRVMEASAPSVDLTALAAPFGLLPPETQAALKAHEGPVEVYCPPGWQPVEHPGWVADHAYRAAPRPKVETHTVEGAAYFTHNDEPNVAYVTITYTTHNGAIDPASYRVEARG